MHILSQIQDGYERGAVQRNFLKFVSQTIKRDLEKNHPKVFKKFYVGAKDRKYQFWERNPLSIDLFTKEVFIIRWNTFITIPWWQDYACIPNTINIRRQSFIKAARMSLVFSHIGWLK